MKTSVMKSAAVGVLMGVGLFGAASAEVLTFNTTTNATGFLLFSSPTYGLSTHVTFALDTSSLSATSAKFNVHVVNGSQSNDPNTTKENTLVGFAVDVVDPTLTGAVASQPSSDPNATVLWYATGSDQKDTFPTLSKVDLCAFVSSNLKSGCSGSSVDDGLKAGGFDDFILQLTTAGDFTKGISFTSPYGAKYQSVTLNGGQSVELAGCIASSATSNVCGDGTPPPTGDLPEPGSLALAALGLLGAALTVRRKS